MNKNNIPIAESLFTLVIKVAIQLCKNAFSILFFFQIQFCVEFLITKSTFLHQSSCRTRIFAAALWSNFNATVEKDCLKTKEIRSRTLVIFWSGVVLDCIDSLSVPSPYFENVSAPPQYILTDVAN